MIPLLWRTRALACWARSRNSVMILLQLTEAADWPAVAPLRRGYPIEVELGGGLFSDCPRESSLVLWGAEGLAPISALSIIPVCSCSSNGLCEFCCLILEALGTALSATTPQSNAFNATCHTTKAGPPQLWRMPSLQTTKKLERWSAGRKSRTWQSAIQLRSVAVATAIVWCSRVGVKIAHITPPWTSTRSIRFWTLCCHHIF